MRRQKIISMTDAHFEAASKMKNFSGWVREQLEKYIQAEESNLFRVQTYVCKKCVKGEAVEFQRGPVNDRVRGLRFPPSVVCAACGNEASRWDLA